MKKTSAFLITVTMLTAFTVNKASAKSFDTKNTIVTTELNGHQVTQAFNKKGNLIYTIERFSTDNLAKNIIDAVRQNYGIFFITSMEKIKQGNDTAVFIVHAQDKNSLKTFRVLNGEVELIQDFVKG